MTGSMKKKMKKSAKKRKAHFQVWILRINVKSKQIRSTLYKTYKAVYTLPRHLCLSGYRVPLPQ